MQVRSDQDTCTDCGLALPSEDPRPKGVLRTPCPSCGSVRRTKGFAATMASKADLGVNVDVIIGWQEVDRLVDKAEYGAALLVAAINVQFVRYVTPATTPTEAPHAERSPASDSLALAITKVRNRIAHERGYFALLTQLKDPDWPEARIRQVLESAREFCHGNAP